MLIEALRGWDKNYLFYPSEQITQRYSQLTGYAQKGPEGWVKLSSFKPCYMGAVEAGNPREVFLGKFSSFSCGRYFLSQSPIYIITSHVCVDRVTRMKHKLESFYETKTSFRPSPQAIYYHIYFGCGEYFLTEKLGNLLRGYELNMNLNGEKQNKCLEGWSTTYPGSTYGVINQSHYLLFIEGTRRSLSIYPA